ncbi:hypothetical protein MTR_3g435760 [Medicago truncatula]|uniref:Reverse transcriptase domain-containing protein n=1 Tax=Medicago truncatula TaxID=3880 RepID=A0A072V573_MEDTR|nr:hypothetical protein MTR_3g435760 [Medicago truncatula]
MKLPIRCLKLKFGQMAKQLADQSQGGFSGNTKENPKNETCKAIGLRSKKVLPPFVPPTPKNVDEIVVEDVEDGVVEKNYGEVNIPFTEALNKMPLYAKFMKELLSGKKRPKDDENISLLENCSAILQKKLPPKMKDQVDTCPTEP